MWVYRLPKRLGPKCSSLPGVAKHDIVRQLGAVPLDYRSTSIEEIVQTQDLRNWHSDDRYDRPNPVTITRPIRLSINKRSQQT
ncbi:hypothetical protein [Microcoleus sp. herbarium2]|uniref:hypothetical protein n=1 Tax=Microcoleus sp. herbarium2 TaxID=3055433 RepID=UPI002FD0E0C9